MKYLLALFASIVVFGCADSYDKPKPAPEPKETPGRYRSEGGDYPVGAIPVGTLHDAQRNKDIDLVIEYPSRGEGPFPVIVFSHGFGASNKDYVGLTEYWAGHGYVCIKPSHAYAGKLRDPVRDGKPVQLPDPRVKAIVAMSPQGISTTRGLTAESFRNVKIPAMFMTGDNDRGATESETPEWRRTAFDNAPAGDKYFVLIN